TVSHRHSFGRFALVAALSIVGGVVIAYSARHLPMPKASQQPTIASARPAPSLPARSPAPAPSPAPERVAPPPPPPPLELPSAPLVSPRLPPKAPAPRVAASPPPRSTPRTSKALPEPAVGYLTLDTEPWAVVYLGSRQIGTT